MGVLSITIAAATFTAGLTAAAGRLVSGAAPARQMIALLSSPSNVVREIVDPATGDRWLLEDDPASPGGPGRLVRVADEKNGGPQAATSQGHNEKASPPRVVRAGDRVLVEEHTTVMDARLEGVALSGARSGATLRVRLKIGGRIVSAVALGPGRVVITPAMGAQP